MAKVKLGSKEFDADCETIEAWNCGVTDADCVVLGARLRAGDFKRLTLLDLVSFCLLFEFNGFL